MKRTEEMRRGVIIVTVVVPLLVAALLVSSEAAFAQSAVEDQYLSNAEDQYLDGGTAQPAAPSSTSGAPSAENVSSGAPSGGDPVHPGTTEENYVEDNSSAPATHADVSQSAAPGGTGGTSAPSPDSSAVSPSGRDPGHSGPTEGSFVEDSGSDPTAQADVLRQVLEVMSLFASGGDPGSFVIPGSGSASCDPIGSYGGLALPEGCKSSPGEILIQAYSYVPPPLPFYPGDGLTQLYNLYFGQQQVQVSTQPSPGERQWIDPNQLGGLFLSPLSPFADPDTPDDDGYDDDVDGYDQDHGYDEDN